MVRLLRSAGGRQSQTTWRWIVLATVVAALFGLRTNVLAVWTVGGTGTAVARTGTFDQVGARPTVRVTEQNVLVSWKQSRANGRLLGTHPGGGYLIRRYDLSGHPQEMRTACSSKIAGSGTLLSCTEHAVPDGTWEYSITPVLGSWTGTEGPRAPTAVGVVAAVTLTSPANEAAVHDTQPAFTGSASTEPDGLREITVVISTDRAQVRTLTTTATKGSWSIRPAVPLLEGVYTARAKQAVRDGDISWSAPSTFRVDDTPPSTLDDVHRWADIWHGSDQTVTFQASDTNGSGVATTYFTIDGSTPTTDSARGASVRVGEGVHVLKYFSVDRAGNHESVRTAAGSIRVDKTAPRSANLAPLPDDVHDGQVLAGGGQDALSGVTRVVYEFCAVDSCTLWTEIGSSPSGPDYPVVWNHQPANGIYQVRTRVLDAAGNATTSDPHTVRVDNPLGVG